MISQNELLTVKSRLMLAADAANLIVSSPGPAPVRFTEEQYWRVHESLSRMKEDLSLVLSELDTLRALFVDSVNDFFEAKVVNEISIGTDVVAAVPDNADRGGGETARNDEAVSSEPVAAGRSARRRRPKSAKPGANTAGLPGTAEGLEPRNEGQPVGGQPSNEE